MLTPVYLTQREARVFVQQYHRHHDPPRGDIFRVAVATDDEVVGVAMVGRPVARMLDDHKTAEVIRCCVRDLPEARHAASKLYAMAWRVARELGFMRLITYTLSHEKGTSLVAAGWKMLYSTQAGRSWSTPSRPRLDHHPLDAKTLWQICA